MTRSQIRLLLAGVAVTLALLFSPIHFATDQEFWERLMDAAHVPFFAAFTLFLTAILPAQRRTPARRVGIAGAAAALFAGAVEVFQPFVGRGDSLTDLINGLIGVALAVGGWHVLRFRWPTRVAFCVAALALLLAASHPAWRELRGILWREANFPLLADFESEDEMRLWAASENGAAPRETAVLDRATSHVSRGTHSLRIVTSIAQWPGARLRTGQADWRGFEALAFDVFNPGAPIALAIRIDDDARVQVHDERYNGTLLLNPGWNYLRTPLGEIERGPRSRLLRLQAIRRVLFFLDSPGESRTLHLDHVRLEK